MGESVFAAQSDILVPEVAMTGPSTHGEDLEDVGRNAELYISYF